MKSFNLKKVFIGLAVMSILITISTLASVGQEKAKGIAFPVRIKYVDAGKTIPNTVVYFAYWNEKSSKLVEASANTGNGQVVTFKVPYGEDGSTYPFVIRFSKDDMETVRKSAGSGNIRAYRIPTDADGEYLELEMNKDGSVGNKGCSIQIWSM